MPIVLIDSASENKEVLDIIRFISSENGENYFEISNSNSDKTITVEYPKSYISNWDDKRYELILLETDTLDAEANIFELYVNTLGERMGWLIPITALESLENFNLKNLADYCFIAYKKLLDLEIELNLNDLKNSQYSLSHFFKDKIVCITCNDTTGKISGYKFSDYILSFYLYTYIPSNSKDHKIKHLYNRSDLKKKFETISKVTINKSEQDITKNIYLEKLFIDSEVQTDSFITKFILLYQIIEILMEKVYESEIGKKIEDYQSSKISKNDLREKLVKLSKEKSLIHKVFEGITINENEIITNIQDFYKVLNKETDDLKSVASSIYSFRNLILHNLSSVIHYKDDILNIVNRFENIVVDLLIKYNK